MAGDCTIRLKQELGDVPLGELQRMRSTVGARKYCESVYDRAVDPTGEVRLGVQAKTLKRANKNRPREMSSKKPVSRFQQVVEVPKKVVRDPRFDERSGHFNSGLFSKAYSFLDEYKAKEKQTLERELKKTKNKNRKEEISAVLKDMEQTEAKQAHTKTAKVTERELKKNERKLVRQGKKPFYLKKSDQKKLALAEKFLELKTKGKLDKFMAKRRKRTTAKERRFLPYRRWKDTDR